MWNFVYYEPLLCSNARSRLKNISTSPFSVMANTVINISFYASGRRCIFDHDSINKSSNDDRQERNYYLSSFWVFNITPYLCVFTLVPIGIKNSRSEGNIYDIHSILYNSFELLILDLERYIFRQLKSTKFIHYGKLCS